ncbi:hypothetical protein [Bacillus cereus]|uniref:Group-specific protein n=1 Tax=Bacillus cereus TaxID=1396 RepID=A0ABD4LMW1_BACCE|nr:hypothetical protein [Bacillus cereus]MBK1611744.1 hypothetical protein [Bacillus cereus]
MDFKAFETKVSMKTENGSETGLVVKVDTLSQTLLVRADDNEVYEVSMWRVDII